MENTGKVEQEQSLLATPQATPQTSVPPLPPSHPADVLEARAPAMLPPRAEEEYLKQNVVVV